MNPWARAYEQYRRVDVETASSGKLILMLYDGAIRFCRQAASEWREGQEAQARSHVYRAQDILAELIGSLNFDAGPLATNLFQLYEYMNYRLIQSGLRRDPAAAEEVAHLLEELRQTWAQVLTSSASQA